MTKSAICPNITNVCEERTSKGTETKHGQSSVPFLHLNYYTGFNWLPHNIIPWCNSGKVHASKGFTKLLYSVCGWCSFF